MRFLDWMLNHWPGHRTTPVDPETGVVNREKEQMTRDLEQVKRLNEYLLDRAVARGHISQEEAAAIRATQTYEGEDLSLGHDL